VHNFQTRFGRETLAQVLDQVGVHFDGDDAGSALQQFLGEGAAAGANLDDEIFAGGTNRSRDTFENRTFNQEMLTESGARHAGSAVSL
jgi:hypothetical protein